MCREWDHIRRKIRNLELIGEAATYIPEAVRQENPEIPWRMIIATRDRLIHNYLSIDDDTLLNIIKSNVVVLLARLRQTRSSQLATKVNTVLGRHLITRVIAAVKEI